LRRKLFMLAHAFMRVPSTEKCSSDTKACTRGRFSTAAMNAAAMSPSSKRSRFLLKTVGTQTGSFHRKPCEPPEQEVVVELLHELPLRSDRVEGLQQQRPQQLLGRDRGAAVLGIETGELRVECCQGVVGQHADRPQRVVLGDTALGPDVAEKSVPSLVKTAHSARPKDVDPMGPPNPMRPRRGNGLFSLLEDIHHALYVKCIHPVTALWRQRRPMGDLCDAHTCVAKVGGGLLDGDHQRG